MCDLILINKKKGVAVVGILPSEHNFPTVAGQQSRNLE